jgi:hypothetical protein
LNFLSINALPLGITAVFLAITGIFISLLGNPFIKHIIKVIISHKTGKKFMKERLGPLRRQSHNLTHVSVHVQYTYASKSKTYVSLLD